MRQTIKRLLNLIEITTILGLLIHLGLLAQVYAQNNSQQGRIDAFTYLIPFPTEQLSQEFDVGNNTTGLEDIQTTISIEVTRDNLIIYYDHWEDGLEDDITYPRQTTTQVWGDGNLDNGIAPTARPQEPGQDILRNDDVLVLQNLVTLPGGVRNPDTLFYDGGDIFTSIGGAIAASVVVWPQGPGILYAAAWELYPSNQWGEIYRIPIGQDLADQRSGFSVVGLNVQAIKDDTSIQILDKTGAVKTSGMLDYGQQLTVIEGINVGDWIQSSEDHPVQLNLFTANPTANYEARAFTMLPLEYWPNEYLTPRSSDGDYWLFNPDPNTPLAVTVATITSTTVLTIPPESTIRFSTTPTMSTATGAHFTSNDGRPFYGVVALSEGEARDWGYEMQPITRLSSQILIGWAPGNAPEGDINNAPTGDESRVYVTALTTTTVRVRYSGLGLPEASYLVTPLAEIPITSPNHNMTGAFLFTENGTPFVAVWGEDQAAPPALPSIDAGTTTVSLPAMLLQKTFSLAEDADCSGSTSLGDTVDFKLQYFNYSAKDIDAVILMDEMPPALDYVTGSALHNGTIVPDRGDTPFPFDEDGYILDIVPRGETGVVTFAATVNDTATQITNRGRVVSDNMLPGSDSLVVNIPAGDSTPIVEFSNIVQTANNAPVTSGEIITLTMTITNTGPLTFTRMPLQDTFDQNYLTFLNADPQPTITGPGVITWNDLTLGTPLSPGNVLSLTARFRVDPVSDEVTSTQNTATILEATHSDSPALLNCRASAQINMATATPPPPPSAPPATSRPPTSTPQPTSLAPTPTPLPLGSATPTEIADAAAELVFPVEILPETGIKNLPPSRPEKTPLIPGGLILIIVGSLMAFWVIRQKIKR